MLRSLPLRYVPVSNRWRAVVLATSSGRRSISTTSSLSFAVALAVASPFPSLLPSQLQRLPAAKPQSHVSDILSDASSPAALQMLENAQNRHANFSREDLDALQTWQQRRREVAKLKIAAETRLKTTSEGIKKAKASKDEARANELLAQARQGREEAAVFQDEHETLLNRIQEVLMRVPNTSHRASPIGPEECARVDSVNVGQSAHLLPGEQATALQRAGQAETFTLEDWQHASTSTASGETTESNSKQGSLDHLALSELLNPGPTIDMAAGRLASAPSYPYLIGALAKLEQALLQFSLRVAVQKGFHVVSPPIVVKTDIAERCGFNPRAGQGGQTYFVASSTSTASGSTEGIPADHCLVGTAEISLAALVAGRTFALGTSNDKAKSGPNKTSLPLPVKLLAISPSFRAEAGGRGQDTKGLYRLHQFHKAEMFIVCEGVEEESNTLLEELKATQQTLLQTLGITYRTLDMPTEELGASAHRKYDIEAWMPGRGSWGEVSSASNCTDYQSSRLHILYQPSREGSESASKSSKGNARVRPVPAHTLNATLCAVPRMIITLLEQYGIDQENGRLRLPEPLKPHWLGPEDEVDWVAVEKVSPTGRQELNSAYPSSPSGAMPAYQSRRPSLTPHQAAPQARSYSTTPRQSAQSPSTPPGSQTLFARLQARLRSISAETGTDLASLSASFLILHELTAVIPLFALFYLFGLFGVGEAVCSWLADITEGVPLSQRGQTSEGSEVERSSDSWTMAWREKVAEWLDEGLTRIERYARRKGWMQTGDVLSGEEKATSDDRRTLLRRYESGGAWFANALAAYVVVKALVAPRLLLSFYLSPAFARTVFEPGKRAAQRARAAWRARSQRKQ